MTLTPWGHAPAAGRTGNIPTGGARATKKGRMYFTNYLVENYGRGNGAYIVDNTWGFGSAYGSWHADC